MSDEMLMEAVRNGNLQQASVLFDRHHKRIFNFLARMAGDRDDAADLTQNVFLRMIRYRASFRDNSRFVPWIYQIARNVFADYYQVRKTKALRHMEVEKFQDSLEDPSWNEQDHEREELLLRCMSKLTDEQRELLVLTRFQQLKYEEVAQIMNTTVANIKVKVHRAIGKLREHYFEISNT